ncbi:hypothetical protein QYE76_035811 [Lolium multiflorum]|uniref:Transposase (putative) gypsy type domain-containing protein n=1 Tax=Lolium multiflorum TaxID=4521 RepID=A0AAD8VPK2_LOLMU|nr:hypothetical protein QYE76_035811 [Lolium multiflorum]
MGKKKSGSTSEAAKVSRDWSASAISNRDINKLRALGFISASEEDIRLPGLVSRPKPPRGFTVMFAAFLFRGLSLPAHEFLRSLLFFYGIQLWQLTPNSIIHLSIFITVCEAFLGIEPHWGLWRKIFYVKHHNDSNGPPVVGGVGFVVRKEVDYFDYPMKESVQGWRNKWFYLRDPAVSGRRSNLPPFDDVLVAQKKKSWQNALSPEEKATADELFEQIVTLKNTGGLTMCGTEVVSVFLQRRVQPLMSRPHQLWLYTGKGDKSRINSADLSADELRDEVRHLTCLSTKDTIVLTSARPPYDFDHLPSEAPTVAQCYPPSPESGVVLEDDDDDSEGTKDAQHVLEDSDVQEEEAAEDDAFLRSRRRKQVHDDFITSAESSPRGGDNDADEAASPPPVKKSSTSFFAGEDDLDLSNDDGVPLAKRAKLVSERAASAKESNPSPAKSTPPSRTGVEKIPISKVIPPDDAPTPSTGRDHPIYVTVDAVADFAEQFTRLEAENSQLRKAVKSSADQVLEANRLATDAKNENALLKEEVKRLKRQMKDEQDARRAAAAAVDEKEGVLRESVKDLLVLGLQKTKGALSRLYSMIFPKMKQDKTLDEMADAFLVDPSEPVEVLKRRSSLVGVVLTFQLLMGHGMGSELEEFSKALPVDDDNHLVDLKPFKRSAITCANQLLKLVDEAQAKPVPESAPASDAAEENKKIHEEVEAMTDVAHPTQGLWLHRPKAIIMAKFKYRVMKAHYYFDKYYAHLTMVWNTLFPLDQAPETLSGLFTRFKSPERIRQLVRKELLAGAELAFASILACHPSLDLRAVANTERDLGQYYDVARGPAYTVVSRMESCLEKELKAHWDRGTRS